MFKKQAKKAVLLLAGLSLAFSSQLAQPIPTETIAIQPVTTIGTIQSVTTDATIQTVTKQPKTIQPIKPISQPTTQPITPCTKLCIIGYKCFNGNCIPDPTQPQIPQPIIQPQPILHPYDPIDPCYPKVSSPAGCIQSCKDPKFSKCPDVFPALYAPKFCGYNKKENRWANYTYNCQACQNPDIVGIVNQKCHCSFTKCQSTQTCNLQTGQCQPIKIQPKCSANPPNKVDCKVRPTKKECPDLQYIRAPDLVYCGIDRDGNKQGFARSCQVCLDKNYGSYYQAPCDKVPQIFCQDYQFCSIQGVCVDKCAAIRCQAGYQCLKGECVPIKCKTDKDCKSNEFCNVDYCIDKCAVVKCSDGYTCVNGKCQPNKPQPKCSPNPPNKVQCTVRPTKQQCPDVVYIRAPDLVFCGVDKHGNEQGFARSCQVCLDPNFNFYYQAPCDQVPQITCKQYQLCTSEGTCIDKCATIKCKAGYQCKKGQCIPIKCSSDKDCQPNEFCNIDFCINKCALAKCSLGYTCIDGNCVPDSPPNPPDCSVVQCLTGYQCINGQCIKRVCKNDKDCKQNQLCNVDFCIDKCAVTLCVEGHNCINGKCVPISPPPLCSPNDCKPGYACINGKCTQIPVDQCSGKCLDYQRCFNGQCVDKCQFLKCANCYHGQCGVILPPPPLPDCSVIRCKDGYKCENGQCIPIDQCFGKCSNIQFCIKGQCVDKCDVLKCPNCYKGQCNVDIEIILADQKQCKNTPECGCGRICQNGKCVDKCQIIKCKPFQQCKFGFCFPTYLPPIIEPPIKPTKPIYPIDPIYPIGPIKPIDPIIDYPKLPDPISVVKDSPQIQPANLGINV